MFFRPRKNRRRVDVAKKTGELKAAAKHHGPTALKVLGLLAVSVGLTWGGVEGWRWATTTERFALREVVVTGETRATEAELVKLGNIITGSNLVALDTTLIERAIATHPWVRQVRVRRALPSRLLVEVTEHEAVALLSLGELYLVNEDATPFKRVTPTDVMDLPLVTGIDREAFLGEGRAGALAQLRRGVDVASAYAGAFASKGDGLSEVNVTLDGVVLVTVSGQEVRLGDGDVQAGLGRLERVRNELKARSLSAEVIRLDNRSRPEWVTVQLSGGSPEKGNHPK
jgi:cell division protein FtsQ